jgi:hypothetical protein
MKSMKSNYRTYFVLVGFCVMLIVSVGSGFALAIAMFRVDILVDYDTGAECRVSSVGPFNLRSDPVDGAWFSSVVLRNGLTGLTGHPNWHIAVSFKNNSQQSPTFEAGSVLKDLGRLKDLMRDMSVEEVKSVKEGYLSTLSTGGPLGARVFVDRLEIKRTEYLRAKD